MSVLPAVALGLVGVAVGTAADRSAARYPWSGPGRVTAALRPGVRVLRPGVAEALSAVAFALVGLRFGWSPDLPAWAWFVAAGLLLSLIDLRTMLLPNRVLLPAIGVTAALLASAAALDGAWPHLVRALLSGAVCFAVLLGMALLAPAGLGMGDVKLAALLGMVLGWLGWPVVLLGLFLGFVFQAVAGLLLLAVRRAGRSTELPFGPALVVGALVAALAAGDWAAL